MTIYRIHFENYEDCTFSELYHHKENAIQRLTKIWNNARNNKKIEEFEGETIEDFSFFDPTYNEYSTYITLEEFSLDSLFYDKA